VTEAEWLACADPGPMLAFLRCGGKASDRKLRLFACACCRRIWHLLNEERYRKAVDVAERFADRQAGADELNSAQADTELVSCMEGSRWAAAWSAACADAWDAAWESLREAAGWGDMSKDEQRAVVPFLRDIIGNPFRPVTITPAGKTPQVVALAQAAYEERELPSGHLDPTRLAVLADALEEAGCDQAAILKHLRGPGPHVRGCWVVDLLLGKE
jgi:hypothetical protein